MISKCRVWVNLKFWSKLPLRAFAWRAEEIQRGQGTWQWLWMNDRHSEVWRMLLAHDGLYSKEGRGATVLHMFSHHSIMILWYEMEKRWQCSKETQAIYIERKWLQCSASWRGEKKKKLGIKSPWAIYTSVEENMLLRRKYQISIGRRQVRITQNRGSQKGFLRHLDGNFICIK